MEDGADKLPRLAAACDRRSQAPREDQGGGWSEVPTDVLYQVMCRVSESLPGRLSLAVICRHWHAAVRLALPCHRPTLCLAHPDGRFFTFQHTSSALKIHINDPNCRAYRGATGSQLLLATDCCGVYSLVSLFTGRRRLLPVPSGIRLHDDDDDEPGPDEGGYLSEEMPVRKLVVCPDGLVAAIVGHERSAKVALCEPESAAWSWSLSAQDDPWRWYADMVFFDGKLYTLTNDEDLLALEVGYDHESGEPRISRVERAIDGGDNRYSRLLQDCTRTRYLVVRRRGAGLVMVCKAMLEHGTYEFLVFQADLRSSRWVRVDTLGGDEALFVGRLSSRAVRADRHGVRGDQIFFVDDSAGMEGSGGLYPYYVFANVYDMKDGSVSELLRTRPRRDGTVPMTWIFREEPDAEE